MKQKNVFKNLISLVLLIVITMSSPIFTATCRVGFGKKVTICSGQCCRVYPEGVCVAGPCSVVL